jgi:altronate dehydratase
MKTNINGILINDADNVITLTTSIKKGETVGYQKGGEIIEINVVEDIPVFHKVAIADIKKNAQVYKYGQMIGKAIVDVARGSHVHDHNIASPP